MGDSDSTSGCSADMSNADSGRGPSEDGEGSRNGGKIIKHRMLAKAIYELCHAKTGLSDFVIPKAS